MRESLPHREPFLDDRELIPVFRPDPPGHMARDIITAESGISAHDPLGLLEAAQVMVDEAVDPPAVIAALPVARKRQPDRIIPHPDEAVQIVSQGILHHRPGRDVRCDGEEHMVAGEHDAVLLEPEHAVARRMARREDHPELHIPGVKNRAVVNRDKAVVDHPAPCLHRRIVPEIFLHQVFRKAFLEKPLRHRPRGFSGIDHPHIVQIPAAQIHPAVFSGSIGGEPAVV